MIAVSTLALYPEQAYEDGLNVVTTSLRVIPPDCLDPRVKCIGRYASNILAKAEANRAGAGEGLMLNGQGYLAECTGDNLFLVRDGQASSRPHPACGILEGITRNTVMALARGAGYAVEEAFLTPFDVSTADEAFLTGTAAEVIPDGHPRRAPDRRRSSRPGHPRPHGPLPRAHEDGHALHGGRARLICSRCGAEATATVARGGVQEGLCLPCAERRTGIAGLGGTPPGDGRQTGADRRPAPTAERPSNALGVPVSRAARLCYSALGDVWKRPRGAAGTVRWGPVG